MRGVLFVTFALLTTACQGRTAAAGNGADSLQFSGMVPRDSADSVLLAPRVITGPTVIIFWLVQADTLPPDDQAAALDEMTFYTEKIVPALERYGVALVPTNADTVYVELPNRERRMILLAGLEYPFGYVIVEPGGTERILSGVYGDEELLEEVRTYFDFPNDSTATRPRVTT